MSWELRSRHNTQQEKGDKTIEGNSPTEPKEVIEYSKHSDSDSTPDSIVNDPNKDNIDPPKSQLQTQEQIKLAEVPVMNMSDFEEEEVNVKLNRLMVAINTINTNFHHKVESLHNQITGVVTPKIEAVENAYVELAARVDDLEQNQPSHKELLDKIGTLESTCVNLKDDVALIKGIIQVQDKQIKTQGSKLVDLTTRSMAKNIIISGILEQKEEDCKAAAFKFLRELLKMEVKDSEVEVAHRAGPYNPAKTRQKMSTNS